MTEAEWLACVDPGRMLAHLKQTASHRKLRLFGCACCRAIWHLLFDERARRAVEVAERYADGQADESDRHQAEQSALEFAYGDEDGPERVAVVRVIERWRQPRADADVCARFTRTALRGRGHAATQAELLWCIIGNPFRTVPCLGPDVTTWNHDTVRRMAGEIYEQRRFGDLPILADALEDAGCTDEALLTHLRDPGPHVRGCWVIDLILGKS